MTEIKEHFCPNVACKRYGLSGLGNLVKAGVYTRKSNKEKRQLLKCTVCGHRFSETNSTLFVGIHYSVETIGRIIVCTAEGLSIRSTATQLGLSKDRVNKILLKADAYTEMVVSNLLRSLHLNENQLDKLWMFISNRNARRRQASCSLEAGKDADNMTNI
jgi:transposase-like protein